MILNDLPLEHPLRNTPLGEINAKYKWKKASETAPWLEVKVGAPKLATFTYNQLGETWTNSDWWKTDDM
jgi:hypothetical protein